MSSLFNNIANKISQTLEKVVEIINTRFSWLKSSDDRYLKAEKEHQQRINDLSIPEVQAKIKEVRNMIGQVEGQELDDQQIYSIAYPSHSDLVLAGAGAGKTTTIIGKVKYLLATGQATPQNLLILSFTNASSSEMKERVRNETGKNIYVATFHKLALDIVKKVEEIAPNVYDKSLQQFVKESIDRNLKNPNFQKAFITYLMYEQLPEKSDLGFSNQVEYNEYLELYPPVTFKNEKVKSYGEVCIVLAAIHFNHSAVI